MATTDESAYVSHPLLTAETIERREYQLQLADQARNEHTLVSLPTGLGKTTVSLLVTAQRFEAVGGKALLLAPTKPLVEQHAAFYREALTIPDDEIVVFTGEVRPADRATLWDDARVVIATPQVIENDLIGGRIALESVTHCTFDECHRATGDYAYTYIAERYHEDAARPLVTGMSASPGSDRDEIRQVCSNLGIRSVEVMTDADADVSEYTHQTDVEWVTVELPEEIAQIRDALQSVLKDRLGQLRELGVTQRSSADLSQKDLNRLRGKLQTLIDNDDSAGYKGMSIHAELMKLRRAIELIETQSVKALARYFERQRQAARSSGASKASQRFVSEPTIKEAMRLTDEYEGRHPKFKRAHARLAETLGIEDGERVIVFTESRDTAEVLTDVLAESFETRRFVGQSDTSGSEGMTQREQQAVLEAFRDGEFEVLVSTSVAEEGLDVPEVDLVLFYEPVPTAIRSVQRKGRTGRQTEGSVVVLMTEDTRDEAYFWISRRREQEMQEELQALKEMSDELDSELSQAPLDAFDEGDAAEPTEQQTQPGLDAFGETATNDDTQTVEEPPTPANDGIEIVIDQRELDATIARSLSKRDEIATRLETLAVGDYICSDRAAVERKTVEDFLATLLGEDRSLFEQIGDLTRQYRRPILLLEGDGLYERRDVHPNAIHGALASLTVDFGVSILQTADEDETVELLATIATREQKTQDRTVSVHGEKQSKTLAEQQEYVVASIAEVGPVTARSLLEAFGTVEAALTASYEELLTVEGVGEVTADRIREVITSEYDPR